MVLNNLNSPAKILSRLIHEDVLRYIPQSELTLLAEKISIHKAYCQHSVCRQSRSI